MFMDNMKAIAGGGFCSEGSAALGVMSRSENQNAILSYAIPLCNTGEESGTSDDDIVVTCHRNEHSNVQVLLGERERHTSSNPCLAAAMTQPSPGGGKAPKRKVSKFYRKQSDLVENFRKDSTIIEEYQRRRQKTHSFSQEDAELRKMVPTEETISEKVSKEAAGDLISPAVKIRGESESSTVDDSGMAKTARLLAMVTLITNVSLVIAKMAASYLSGSLSIISSLVDSAVDITSGLVIWLTARAIKKRDPYMYPRGRTRLEPIALIIVSVIMGIASVQMVVQSVESIIHDTVHPQVDMVSFVIMVTTVVVKFVLMILCRRYSFDPSVAILAQDHRNDCISNVVAILCAWLASSYWIYFDPIGAIIVSVYIAVTWLMTGKEHLAMLSGKSAKPEFINRIVRVCVEHDKRIDYIDTVYVYHFGTRFLVEVHIVMDPNMTLKESHDISEALQTNIESLLEVERAFVHCDYEFNHLPADEHKVV